MTLFLNTTQQDNIIIIKFKYFAFFGIAQCVCVRDYHTHQKINSYF